MQFPEGLLSSVTLQIALDLGADQHVMAGNVVSGDVWLGGVEACTLLFDSVDAPLPLLRAQQKDVGFQFYVDVYHTRHVVSVWLSTSLENGRHQIRSCLTVGLPVERVADSFAKVSKECFIRACCAQLVSYPAALKKL